MTFRPAGSVIPAIACLAVCLTASCRGDDAGRRKNVPARGDSKRPNLVLIVMDTARADFLSAYGNRASTSPFLERFAESAVRFDRAYSTTNWTLPAHATMFTGRLPDAHDAVQSTLKVNDRLPLLAEQLTAGGYDCAAFSATPWVSEQTGLARGFGTYEAVWSREPANPDTARHRAVRGVERWLSGDRDTAKPFFLFVNLIEPHMPYAPPWELSAPILGDESRWRKGIDDYFDPGAGFNALLERFYSGTPPLVETDFELLRDLYSADLRYTDALVEATMSLVDAASDPADTLVFVLSDHGENIADHGLLGHLFNLYETNIRVPWLARGPGFSAGTVDDRLVSLADVYPTFLGAAGLDSGIETGGTGVTGIAGDPGNLDGIDLRAGTGTGAVDRIVTAMVEYPTSMAESLSAESRSSERFDAYEKTLNAAIARRWKAIRGSDGSLEIYDLIDDPGESRPVDPSRVDPEELARLLRRLSARGPRPHAADTKPPSLADDPAVPEEVRESLRALGYLQ